MTTLSRRIFPILCKPAKAVAHLLFSQKTISRLQSKFLPRDLIYDTKYFIGDIEGPAGESASTVTACIMSDLAPRTVIDVGCGTGALLVKLRDAGCNVEGLEYAEAARAMCQDRGLNVRRFDIVRDTLMHPKAYDVAISMEVAEHLPARATDRYIGLLTRLSKSIIFTAAPPGQGGTDHVNEQPHEYWIEKFHRRDFVLDGGLRRVGENAARNRARFNHGIITT